MSIPAGGNGFSVPWKTSLREKCSNTEFSSGPNTGKYGPGKTPYLDTLHSAFVYKLSSFWQLENNFSI